MKKCCEDFDGIYRSYHLNGLEVEQAARAVLGKDFNPPSAQKGPHPPSSTGLQEQVTALHGEMQRLFNTKADFAVIGQTKQKEDESVEDFRVRL